MQAKKELKKNYYSKWDADEHLTPFGKHLDDDKRSLIDRTSPSPTKTNSNFIWRKSTIATAFDKQEMLTWEQQPPNIKTDYVEAKNYFERIVKATDTYEQNAGGGTAGRNNVLTVSTGNIITPS